MLPFQGLNIKYCRSFSPSLIKSHYFQKQQKSKAQDNFSMQKTAGIIIIGKHQFMLALPGYCSSVGLVLYT